MSHRLASGIAAAIVVLAATDSSRSQTPPVETDHLAAARDLLAGGHTEGALAAFETALEIDGESLGARLGIANAEFRLRRFADAAENAARAAELATDELERWEAWNLRGVALAGLAKTQPRALAEAERALRVAIGAAGERTTASHYSLAALLGSARGTRGKQEGLALLRELLADPPNAEMERRARIVGCDYARQLRETGAEALQPASDRAAGEGAGLPVTRALRMVQPPVAVHAPEPVGHEIAGLDATLAEVIVRVAIDTDGCVREATIVDGLGGDPDELALAAAQRWVFRPARADGEPVPATQPLRLQVAVRASPPAGAPAVPTPER